MHSVCTTYYANRSTTAVDRLLSTISIAEFLMCLPFHTLQSTHKIPTRLYMGTLAGRALFGWSLSVSEAGYAKSVRRCQNCLLDTKRWLPKLQSSKI